MLIDKAVLFLWRVRLNVSSLPGIPMGEKKEILLKLSQFMNVTYYQTLAYYDNQNNTIDRHVRLSTY